MNYHQTDESGFFVGTFPADESPAEPGAFLIPRGGVTIEPPAVAVNECAKWNGAAWEILPDLRGRVYYLADHSRHEITERGAALPAGALDADPAPTQAELDQAASDQAKRDLDALDMASIRDLRAWVAAQPGAPALLVQREQQAATLRAKVLP